MFPWVNFAILAVSTLLFLWFYVLSVGPVRWAQRIGDRAWTRCRNLRIAAGVFEGIITANYILYLFYPLPLGLPERFPWPWWVSILIALVIGVPASWLMIRGLIDAGAESMSPRPEHTLYGGIYRRMRHPQAVGEMPLFWVIAFLLHSPFLVIWSVIYVPIFVIMCWAEERDLLLRYGQAYEEYRRRVGIFRPKSN
jgi:protein-S-isoprenylcysteine O-methyltransferase Ste14